MESAVCIRVKTLIAYLILIPLISLKGYGFQQNISGNIKNIRGANKYPHTSVSALQSGNSITVTDPSGFFPGDTVLLIQMQGVSVYTTPYGQYAAKYGEPGRWEFLLVNTVSANDIFFTTNIKNSFAVNGNIQLVKTPTFVSASVVGELVCDPWDPLLKSGGVLPLIVAGTLILQDDIDVSSQGFKGGKADAGDGICQVTSSAYQLETYPESFTNAAWKGEGAANYTASGSLLLPANSKGSGCNFTGGGGGNGNHSGGGGGSNRGTGGWGGNERNTCMPAFNGAHGGLIGEYSPSLLNRIFPGGGGGASTRSATGTTGPGGNGGGIVIIVADKITGAGGNINAKGGEGGSGGGTGPSGAAGGGGGGSIALSVTGYSGTTELNVTGGKGGDNIGRQYGEGGGGGGGLVWLSQDNIGNLTWKLAGGAIGSSSSGSATDGGIGQKKLGFIPSLNGFLFNSIRSSVSGNRYDSIPSGSVPPKITGTIPVGGTSPYQYTWEKSYNESFTSPVMLSATTADYTPSETESSTVWFRRKVTDSSLPVVLVDCSIPVRFSMRTVTGTEKLSSGSGLSVYPNPTRNELTLKFSDISTGRIEIIISSVSGKVVRRIISYKGDEQYIMTIELTDLEAGPYQVMILLNGRRTSSGRFIRIR